MLGEIPRWIRLVVPEVDAPRVRNIELDFVVVNVDFRVAVRYERDVRVLRPFIAIAQTAKVICFCSGMLLHKEVYNSAGLMQCPVINPIIFLSDKAFCTTLADIHGPDVPKPKEIAQLPNLQAKVHGRIHNFRRYHFNPP